MSSTHTIQFFVIHRYDKITEHQHTRFDFFFTDKNWDLPYNSYIILDGLEGETIIVSPIKEPSNTIIIIYIGLCVSAYYLTVVSDCQLPLFLFTNSAYRVSAYVEQSSSGNIQVTEYCPGNNVSEHAPIYVDNTIAVLVTKRVEYPIFF